jgi:hypothetical protein
MPKIVTPSSRRRFAGNRRMNAPSAQPSPATTLRPLVR